MDDLLDNLLDNNIEEDRERLQRRKERAVRMHREKRQQMRRRRKMKLLLIKSTAVLVPALVLMIAITAIGKDNEETLSVSAEVEEAETKKSWFGNKKQENPEEGDTLTAESVLPSEITEEEEILTSEGIGTKEPMLAVSTGEVYSFDATSKTSTIYNEEVISSNAILIDESTDTIIASKSAKERISPASMTKVLTILVAAEHITEEQLDDTFTMTREITDYGYINDCSSVGFLDGEQVKVRDMFYGTILPSGCDAAVGLATYVAGSHEAFVDMMNEKLEELGLGNSSHYTNCVGLYDENHYSTVYDMAVIMKAAVQNEFCKKVLSEHSYTTTPTTEHPEGINISNWFLRRIEDKDTGGEVLCAKTGYVMQSKNCAVSYGTFANGDPYICVTAGSSSSWRCIYDHVEIYNEYVLA